MFIRLIGKKIFKRQILFRIVHRVIVHFSEKVWFHSAKNIISNDTQPEIFKND